MPEFRELLGWLGRFPRSPGQTHGIGESDSEVLRVGPGRFLATTVDTISEEIAYGLYRDPFTMGWMAGMAAVSDLAAVGATPAGLLWSASFGPGFGAGEKARAARGLREALRRVNVCLLGGDTGSGRATQLTGVGVGFCRGKPLSRIGLRPGDWLCATGRTGLGPALGFRHLLGREESELRESWYRPVARVDAGSALRGLASAAMDGSDGLMASLHTLGELNGVSFELEWHDSQLEPRGARFCAGAGLPLSSLWFGEHGDFQLVAGVPERTLARARSRVKDLRVLGRVRSRRGKSSIRCGSGRPVPVDPGFLTAWPKRDLAEFRAAFDAMVSELRQRRLP